MHIHLPWILAVGPNLKLKTGPKQLLAYLPLDIALPAQTGTRQVGSTDVPVLIANIFVVALACSLSLASLSGLVYCLWVSSVAYPRLRPYPQTLD